MFAPRLSMKKKALVVLLSLGALGGFASAFAGACHHRQWKRQAFEQKVTDICSEAVKQAQAEKTP